MIRCREYRRTSSTVSSAAGVTSGGNDTDILPGRPAWAGTASWFGTLLVPREVNQPAGPGIPARQAGKCHRFRVQLMTCRSQPRPPATGRRPQHRCFGRRCCRSYLTWAGRPTRAARCPTRPRYAGLRCLTPRLLTTTSARPQTGTFRRAGRPTGRTVAQLMWHRKWHRTAHQAGAADLGPAARKAAGRPTARRAAGRPTARRAPGRPTARRTAGRPTARTDQAAAGQASSPRCSRRRWPAPGRPGRSCRGPASRRGGTSGGSDR